MAHSCWAMSISRHCLCLSGVQALKQLTRCPLPTRWILLRESSLIVPLGENLFAGCHGNTMLEKQAAWDSWVPYRPPLKQALAGLNS